MWTYRQEECHGYIQFGITSETGYDTCFKALDSIVWSAFQETYSISQTHRGEIKWKVFSWVNYVLKTRASGFQYNQAVHFMWKEIHNQAIMNYDKLEDEDEISSAEASTSANSNGDENLSSGMPIV